MTNNLFTFAFMERNNSDLDNQVNHRIAILAGLLKRQVSRIIAECGVDITPDQWVVLSYLWYSNGLSIGELVTKSRKDFANVTRIVDKLQKQGYVTKQKSEKDNRSYLVFYTDKALSIRDDIEKCQQRSSAISLEGLSKNEQEFLLQIMEKMEKNSLLFLEHPTHNVSR